MGRRERHVLQHGCPPHKVSLKGKNLSNEQGHYGALNFSTFLFNNTASWLPGEPRTWEISYAFTF